MLESPDIREDDELQRWLQERSELEISASLGDIVIYLEKNLKTIKCCDEKLKSKILKIISTKAQR